MTIHPDSLSKSAPTHYYCSRCGAKHLRGSVRYQNHYWSYIYDKKLRDAKAAKAQGDGNG
jgi:hypothetical protein